MWCNVVASSIHCVARSTALRDKGQCSRAFLRAVSCGMADRVKDLLTEAVKCLDEQSSEVSRPETCNLDFSGGPGLDLGHQVHSSFANLIVAKLGCAGHPFCRRILLVLDLGLHIVLLIFLAIL